MESAPDREPATWPRRRLLSRRSSARSSCRSAPRFGRKRERVRGVTGRKTLIAAGELMEGMRPFVLNRTGAADGAFEQRRHDSACPHFRFERVAAGLAQRLVMRERAADQHERGDVERATSAKWRHRFGDI